MNEENRRLEEITSREDVWFLARDRNTIVYPEFTGRTGLVEQRPLQGDTEFIDSVIRQAPMDSEYFLRGPSRCYGNNGVRVKVTVVSYARRS